jgi:hypothetical protein
LPVGVLLGVDHFHSTSPYPQKETPRSGAGAGGSGFWFLSNRRSDLGHSLARAQKYGNKEQAAAEGARLKTIVQDRLPLQSSLAFEKDPFGIPLILLMLQCEGRRKENILAVEGKPEEIEVESPTGRSVNVSQRKNEES